ncbi:MAG: type II toxin-antitoxin system VapC family toxin [Elusimicrobia bacterium]|nr:type II toxin-antitoxin system VapC family toxin [Elusimicrobiota bacterium]
MRLALDTSGYSAAGRGQEKPARALKAADEIYVPFITLAELRAGFAVGGAGKKNEAKLIEFLNSPRVRILYADEQTTHHYAGIFAYLKNKGTPIPTNDLWIAALALEHDLPLLTTDSHFSKIPQLATL